MPDTEKGGDHTRELEEGDFEMTQLRKFQCQQFENNMYGEGEFEDLKKDKKWVCDDKYIETLSADVRKELLPAKMEEGAMTQKLLLFSYVFQTFVMMQIFNQFNARKLDEEINVFSGLFRNMLFINITIFTILMQFAMVEFGGPIVKCWPLNLN